MNNLNLDISKYTCDELYEIFSIDEKTRDNENSLMKHFSNFKNSIMINNSLPISKKDNISIFLSQVLEKLVKNLNLNLNNNNNNNNNLTYNSNINNIISESPDNHPLIANQNELAGKNANTYDGDTFNSSLFQPGYINPINIKSIRRTINIDSKFRDNYFNSKSSDYIVDLPETFKKVVKMKLTAFEIPTTLYYINKSHSNNYFHYSIGDSECSDCSSVTLKDGNYTTSLAFYDLSNNIENYINTQIRLIHPSLNYKIDKISGKSVFTHTDNSFSIYFNKHTNGKDDLDTPLIMKLGWILGFRLGTYYSCSTHDCSNQIISEGICLPNGPQYLFLAINDFTNAGNNHFVAAFNSSILSPHILARFNYQTLLQDSDIYSFTASINQDLEEDNRIRSYFGPVNINRLHIQILDEYGRVVDLNNMDWSFTLALDVLYD